MGDTVFRNYLLDLAENITLLKVGTRKIERDRNDRLAIGCSFAHFPAYLPKNVEVKFGYLAIFLKLRDEIVRRKETFLGVYPARQSLHAAGLAAYRAHYGLIVDLYVAFAYRLVNVL